MTGPIGVGDAAYVNQLSVLSFLQMTGPYGRSAVVEVVSATRALLDRHSPR